MKSLSLLSLHQQPTEWPTRRRRLDEEEEGLRGTWWLALVGLCACAFAAGWLVPGLIPRLSAHKRATLSPVAHQAIREDPATAEVSENVSNPVPNVSAAKLAEPVLNPAQPARPIVATAPSAATPANFHNRARVRFEATLNQTQEITPGLKFHIDRINAPTNHFDGWLQSTDGTGRALTLENSGLLHTIPFSGKDGRRFDLIVTDLQPGHLTGYVVLPSN